MKRIVLSVAATIFSMVVNAQTIGGKLGTEVFLPTRFTNVAFSPEAGVYFDQPLIGRLGISVGADYVYTYTQPRTPVLICCFGGGCPTIYKTEIVKHGLQLPISLKFDVFRSKSRSFYGTLLYGINPAGDLARRTTIYGSQGVDRTESGALENGTIHLRAPMHAGFEVRRVFACKGSVAFGATVILPTGSLKYAYSEVPLRTVSIYLKTGFNLKKSR